MRLCAAYGYQLTWLSRPRVFYQQKLPEEGVIQLDTDEKYIGIKAGGPFSSAIFLTVGESYELGGT